MSLPADNRLLLARRHRPNHDTLCCNSGERDRRRATPAVTSFVYVSLGHQLALPSTTISLIWPTLLQEDPFHSGKLRKPQISENAADFIPTPGNCMAHPPLLRSVNDIAIDISSIPAEFRADDNCI